VAEAAAQVPFRIECMFAVMAPGWRQTPRPRGSTVRQFMICVSGAVYVVCEDGERKIRLRSSAATRRGLWNTVEFWQNESVLVVLCDRVYKAHEYIRDYAEFLSFRESIRA
jgi:hypothetical protein